MKTIIKIKIFSIAIAALLPVTAPQAQSDSYPSKPISLIVPTGAGGGTDLVARVIQKSLSENLGQPVVVENKVGAGGIIGTMAVAKAQPDGYTLMVSANQFAMIPAIKKSVPFDPLNDFTPIASVGVMPTLLVVNPKVPANSVKELIAYAKQNPNALQYSTAGNGSPNHLFGEMFKSYADVTILHVPYKGTAPAVADVVAGNVSLIFASYPTVKGFVKSGQLKGLAITSGKRVDGIDLPAIAETLPGYDADIWYGIWGPANTPKPIVDKVNQAIAKTLKDPAVKEKLQELGLSVVDWSPAHFDAVMKSELAKWNKVVTDSKGAIERD